MLRLTPGRKNTESVTLSTARNTSGVKMSPSRARTAMRRRLAPPNSSAYSRKVRM